jgi:hypothetical protein
MQTKCLLVALTLLAAAALGCSGGPELIGFLTSSSTQTPAAAQPTQAPSATLPPSTTNTPSSNPPTSGGSVTYPAKVVQKVAAAQCISNNDASAVACSPRGLNILSVTVTRPDAKGPVTISLELAGNGVKDLRGMPLWGLTYAFDLDRNVATGLRDVYPSQHHMGPDLTLLYGEVNGDAKAIYKRYTPSGSSADVDINFVQWSFPDNNHIQATVSSSLIPVEQFYLVGDIVDNDMFDHFVREGYLTFPEGQVVASGGAAPLPTAAAVKTSAPQSSTSASGVIAKAVMATGIKGLNAPVGVTNVFSTGQSIVHAVIETSNAPKGTQIKATWLAVDVSSAPSPNYKLGESKVDAYGTEYVDFNFRPSGGHMSPGTYRVEVYLDGTLDRTLDFSVAGPGTRVPTPPASTVKVESCTPRAPSNAQPSGIIAKLTTTTNIQGSELNPVNSTNVFAPNSVFHVVAATQNAPASTKVTAMWIATDVGDEGPCNGTLLKPSDLTTEGSRNLDFNVRPASKWPVGMYRVEIYVNDVLDSVADFTVK